MQLCMVHLSFRASGTLGFQGLRVWGAGLGSFKGLGFRV